MSGKKTNNASILRPSYAALGDKKSWVNPFKSKETDTTQGKVSLKGMGLMVGMKIKF